MALAVDSAIAAAITSTVSNSASGSFTNAAGGLVVGFLAIGSGSAITVPAITYGGATLANFNQILTDTNKSYVGVFWSATSMPTGANTLAGSFSGTAGGSTVMMIGAISFTGYDTGTPILQGNTNSGSGTSATVAQVSTVVGNILVCLAGGGSSFSATAETLIYQSNVNGLSAGGNSQTQRTAGTGGTVTFTETLGSDTWGACAIEIAAASGGATRGLFQPPALSGLGIGGSFFRDPLQGQPYARSRSSIYVPARMAA